MSVANSVSPTPNDSSTKDEEGRTIAFTIDESASWTERCWYDRSTTTLGVVLQAYERAGMTPRQIFFTGLSYLSQIDGEYFLVDKDLFRTVEGRHIVEAPPLRSLRDQGVSNEAIFRAGIGSLTAVAPAVPALASIPAAFAGRLADLRSRYTDQAIFCAGVSYLARLPGDVEWELQDVEVRGEAACLPLEL